MALLRVPLNRFLRKCRVLSAKESFANAKANRGKISFHPLCSDVSVGQGVKEPNSSYLAEGEEISLESAYFRSFMENNSKYPECTFTESYLVANKSSTNKLVALLRDLTREMDDHENPLENLSFSVDTFQKEFFTTDDIIEIFYLFSKCPRLISIFSDFRSLQMLLIEKIKFGVRDINKSLVILNVMKMMKPRPLSVYYTIWDYMNRKFRKLTNVQVVEFYYLQHFYKHNRKSTEMDFEFERSLAQQMETMTLDEIAVIAYSLFRNRQRPGSLIAGFVAERTCNEITTIDEIQACIFCKFLQYSGRRRIAEKVEEILDKVLSRMQKMSLTCAIHVASVGISVNVENVDVINIVLDRVLREIGNLRLKDIERALLLSLYGNVRISKESDLMKSILEQLELKKDELIEFPLSFLALLNYLVMYEVFPDEFISYALSEEFSQTYPMRKIKKTSYGLLFLDVSVELERPNYKGSRLNPLRRKKMTSEILFSLATQEHASSFRCNKEVLSELGVMYGKESCALKHILPNYATMHPVLCLTKDGVPQEVKNKLDFPRGQIIRAPDDGNLWLCFVALRWQGCLRDHITPNLITETKKRQFQSAGFIPLIVHTFLWRSQTPEERTKLLLDLVQTCVSP